MSFYETKIVERDGTVMATFQASGHEQCNVDEVAWQLNEPGAAKLTAPIFHPNADELVALTREIQIFRDGDLIHWGPLVQRNKTDAGALQWTAPGVLWYFTRRVFGPISINFLANPNFETDMASWTDGGAGASWSGAVRVRGPGTIRLISGSSGDFYRTQTFTVSTGSIGLFIAVAAWYWIDPADPIVATALRERGLYVTAVNSAEGEAWAPITMSTPVGQWVRVETGIHLLPDLVDEPVEVRLYSPQCTIHWGATSATEQESVSSEPEGTDATEMMRRIVDYAQNGAGKSDLNIDTDTPASGITETVAYQFADLANIFATLQTYPRRSLADFDIVLDPGTGAGDGTRTFTTYAPTKGTLQAGSALAVPGADVISFHHKLDGEQTATKVIRRGKGDGSDRELGVATDTSGLDGLVLEDVADAPPEITVDGLDQLAASDLARLKDVVQIPDLEVPAEGWIGVVSVGDTVPITIDWGAVQDVTTRRVMRQTLHPRTDTVTVGFQVNA